MANVFCLDACALGDMDMMTVNRWYVKKVAKLAWRCNCAVKEWYNCVKFIAILENGQVQSFSSFEMGLNFSLFVSLPEVALRGARFSPRLVRWLQSSNSHASCALKLWFCSRGTGTILILQEVATRFRPICCYRGLVGRWVIDGG
jgi:hypothetical protein